MGESERVHAREIKWQSVHARACAKLKDEMRDRYKSTSVHWHRFDFKLVVYVSMTPVTQITSFLNVGGIEHCGYKRGMPMPMLYTEKAVVRNISCCMN